jgi:hypothetical protein
VLTYVETGVERSSGLAGSVVGWLAGWLGVCTSTKFKLFSIKKMVTVTPSAVGKVRGSTPSNRTQNRTELERLRKSQSAL